MVDSEMAPCTVEPTATGITMLERLTLVEPFYGLTSSRWRSRPRRHVATGATVVVIPGITSRGAFGLSSLVEDGVSIAQGIPFLRENQGSVLRLDLGQNGINRQGDRIELCVGDQRLQVVLKVRNRAESKISRIMVVMSGGNMFTIDSQRTVARMSLTL